MIEIRGMQPDELETVHHMLDRAFSTTPKSYFDRQVKNDPFLRPEDTRVLLKDGIIRSCVRIYFRKIYCEGEITSMGGIGDVGTDPPDQGKGYATLLLKDAVTAMRKREVVLSFLFTRINSFYERVGYFTLPTLQLDLQPPPPSKSIFHRKANLDQDLVSLTEIYDYFNKHRVGPIVRNKRYWKSQRESPRSNADCFWVGEENRSITSYVRGLTEGDAIRVQEFGHRPGQEESLRSLIATMAYTLQKKTVHISYISNEVVDLFKDWSPKVAENTALMLRLIQLNRLSSFRKFFNPHQIIFWDSDRF